MSRLGRDTNHQCPTPPTLLLDFIVLKEVCEKFFEDLNNLVKARIDPIHTEKYADKWTPQRERVDTIICDLQRLSIEALNQSLNNLFKEVVNIMEVVEVRRNILYISDSPFFLDASSIITSSIKEDLNITWLTQLHVKPQIPILDKLKKPEPVEDNRVEKLEQELFQRKMLSENLKRQMEAMKEEHRAREEAQARRSHALEEYLKKLLEEIKAMMKEMMEIMKKQAHP